ncbi:MAG: glycosyltransferase [Oscillatoriophycideae cyanobacterium NC_groundwater_1537_Pr4_S-0.65um_50_18]|nr:glycosyltransferase [Oscillatoriophycideae cyanobacterium NC_groundwater_1537_Pr4_S-0.65um_50_18]
MEATSSPHRISTPRVSIVTPSYNQGKFIERTILSVICQDYPDLEYILVDAVSTDETKDILEKYRQDLSVLIVEPDRGQTDALNKGFKQSTGEILAYLNSDDCYADKDTIATAVRYFEENPDVDVIYGRRNCINANGRFTYCPPYRPFCKKSLYLSDYIAQECVFWRREIFEKAGAYVDESFHFAMDYELWLRFLKHGAKFLAVDEFFGLFRSYQEQKSIDLWETVGLPEIARLHETYLGRSLPEKEMVDYYQEYFFGAHPVHNPEASKFSQNIWGSFIMHKKEVLNKQPIDTWGIEEYDRKFKAAVPQA